MRLTFPQCSKSRVEGFVKDIRIMTDYIPDDEYNHHTFQFQCNFNGGNRELTPLELEYNAKYGRVIPLMNVV